MRRFYTLLFRLILFTIIYLIFHLILKALHISFPLSQPKALPPNFRRVLVEGSHSEKNKLYRECMQFRETKFEQFSHWDAPIHALPPYDQVLHPVSATSTVCDHSMEKLRVLVFLNRVSSFSVRNVLRQTYANFSPQAVRSKNLAGNWARMFLVGKPSNEKEEKLLKSENKKFGDVVVVNVIEQYYHNPTLKMLVLFKFLSCFCPTAEYVIKSDDDNYIRLSSLDHLILEEQKKLDVQMKDDQTFLGRIFQPSRNIPMNLGRCGPFGPVRNMSSPYKKWYVSAKEYSEGPYPTFCLGALTVLSMSSVHQMALDCPHTCIGLEPENFKTNQEKPCNWKFEDAFIGSCVLYTQKNARIVHNPKMGSSNWKGLDSFVDKWMNPSKAKEIFVTGLNDTIMQLAHFYYTALDNQS